MAEEISLLDLWKMLKKHLRMIAMTTIVFGFLSMVYSFVLATPIYQASTDILVNRSTESRDQSVLSQDINASLQLINTYSDVIRNDVVLKPVAEELNAPETTEELRNKVKVDSKNNSQVFSISVTDESPERAAELANTVAKVFNKQIKKMMKVDNVTIISKAVAPRYPISPKKAINLLVAIVLGMALGVLYAMIKELADNTVKREEFITDELGWPVLGQVAEFSSSDLKSKNSVIKTEPIQKEDKSQYGRLQRSRRDRV